ncbi:MAG: hypothetical protein ACOX68_00200 [Candidatus Limivicinus sp.]|jgi:hypothetical protein
MKKYKKWLRPLIFTAAGALLGLIYYHFFGCSSGCAISSSPLRTMLWTGVIGLLLSLPEGGCCCGGGECSTKQS